MSIKMFIIFPLYICIKKCYNIDTCINMQKCAEMIFIKEESIMFTLQKKKDKDFVILNLADIQLSTDEWKPEHSHSRIVKHTVNTLIDKTHPDLITLSGDQGWAGDLSAYVKVGELIDSYNIPWTFVWGNHDQQNGYEFLDSVLKEYSKFKNLIYENGPEELGRGNFVIEICDGNSPVYALILMDTHDRLPFINAEGKEELMWAQIMPNQVEWYEHRINELKSSGCNNSAIITHIPIYAYIDAADKAFKSNIDRTTLSIEESYGTECWNDGYKSSFGVQLEGICCYPKNDGVYEKIKELGSTKHYLCGHDHVNCTSIDYGNVRLTYALKTGPGCYWRPEMNGGTKLVVSSDGTTEVIHEFIDAGELL